MSPVPEQKPRRLTRFLVTTAAVFDRPLARVARPGAAILSFIRRSGGRLIRTRRSTPVRTVDTRQWTPALVRQLEWRRFEELCVAYYELVGFRTRVTPAAGGGVDIHLLERNSDATCTLVHAKAWDAYRIGTKGVRELKSAMAAARAADGVLVTPGRFTQEAVALAHKEHILLVDGTAFFAKLTALAPEQAEALLEFATQGDFLTPTCPGCSIKMKSRKSTREGRTFWGCPNYPSCKHTFPITASFS